VIQRIESVSNTANQWRFGQIDEQFRWTSERWS